MTVHGRGFSLCATARLGGGARAHGSTRGGLFAMLCVSCGTAEARADSVRCTLCDAPVRHPSPLRSPVGLGRAVVVLFALVGLADLAAAVLGLRMAGLVDRMIGGDLAAEDRWSEIEDVSLRITGLWSLAYLASIVVFLVWFRRTRVNAGVFDPYGHSLGSGWAVGAWFVPVLNLWMPRRVASDTWDASGSPADRRSPLLLNLWWVTFVLDTVLGNGSTRVLDRAEELAAIARGYRLVAFCEAFSVVHAVIAVLFVLALTRRQDARAHQPWTPAAPGPVPDAPAPGKV